MNEAGLRGLVDAYLIAIQVTFWVSVLFPFVTALFWPWWKSWWGRNIIALEAAIAFTLIGEVLELEFGLVPKHTPGHLLLWTSAVSLWSVPVVLVWRGGLIFLEQLHGKTPNGHGHCPGCRCSHLTT